MPGDCPNFTSAAEQNGTVPLAPAQASLAVPYLVIEPRKTAWSGMLAELWKYRELLFLLTWRDIKVRYKQTVLGAAWAILQPVMTMVVFTIFFGEYGGMKKVTTHWYPLFVYAGLLPWTFFATGVGQAAGSLIGNSSLVSKVYFPRLLVPTAAILAALVDFVFAFIVLFGLMLWNGTSITPNMLLVVPLMIALVFTAVAVGAWLSAATVLYRDFRYVVPFMLQIWMFASPVAYAPEDFPEPWRAAYALNPVAGIIAAIRAAIFSEPIPTLDLTISLASTAVLLAMGTAYFVRVERRLADVV